jgi:hypothetical protein
MEQNPFSEADICSNSQEILQFYKIRKFIAVFTKVHLESVESNPNVQTPFISDPF